MNGQHDGPPSHFTRIVSSQATMIAVGFCLSLSILLAVSPIFVYYYVDIPSRNDERLCQKKSPQFVPRVLTDQSLCKSIFHNDNRSTMTGLTAAAKEQLEKIPVAGCGNFTMAENDLKILFRLIDTSNLPDEDKGNAKIMLCLYAYGDCGDLGKLTKKTKCDCSGFSEFQTETDFKPLIGNFSSCLQAPDFAIPFILSSYTNKTNNGTGCSKNLLPTTSPCLQTCGMYCSPLCNQPGSSIGAKLFHVALYMTIALLWICIAVMFITWLKLRKFKQSQTGLSFCLPLAVINSALSITLIWGQKRIYCRYRNRFESMYNPTKLCLIQGYLAHYGLLWFVFSWLNSVVSALVTVWNPKRFSEKRRKALYFSQLTISIIAPGGIVMFTSLRGIRYSGTNVYSFFCAPTINSFFYTYTLPVNIIVFCGTIVSAIVMYKLHQAKKSAFYQRCPETSQKTFQAYSLVQKRFFFLSILMPLFFAAFATASIIYARTSIPRIGKVLSSEKCSNESQRCGPDVQEPWQTSFAPLAAIVLFWLCAASVVAYVHVPRAARAFWLQLWRKCTRKNMSLRSDDTAESSTGRTRLFSSSSESIRESST